MFPICLLRLFKVSLPFPKTSEETDLQGGNPLARVSEEELRLTSFAWRNAPGSAVVQEQYLVTFFMG